MGMSAALYEKITINEGRVEQSNFDDYRIARMRDTPEINITILDSKSDPTGTGEPATSPIVPAITKVIDAEKTNELLTPGSVIQYSSKSMPFKIAPPINNPI